MQDDHTHQNNGPATSGKTLREGLQIDIAPPATNVQSPFAHFTAHVAPKASLIRHVTGTPLYSQAQIEAFLNEHLYILDQDIADRSHGAKQLFTDIISRMPPWQQVMLMEEPHRGPIYVGSGHAIADHLGYHGLEIGGAYDFPSNSTYICMKQGDHWHSAAEIEKFLNHETGHKMDDRNGNMRLATDRLTSQREWIDMFMHIDAPDADPIWQREGKFVGLLQFITHPHYKELGSSHIEAFAEFNAMFNRFYADNHGDWEKTDRELSGHYPAIWPAFRDFAIPTIIASAQAIKPDLAAHLPDALAPANHAQSAPRVPHISAHESRVARTHPQGTVHDFRPYGYDVQVEHFANGRRRIQVGGQVFNISHRSIAPDAVHRPQGEAALGR